MEELAPHAIKIIQIIWINIILSGDNAVVIALACRGLPPHRQRVGMIAGAGVAVGLRIVFTLLVASLLSTPLPENYWQLVALLDCGETSRPR